MASHTADKEYLLQKIQEEEEEFQRKCLSFIKMTKILQKRYLRAKKRKKRIRIIRKRRKINQKFTLMYYKYVFGFNPLRRMMMKIDEEFINQFYKTHVLF